MPGKNPVARAMARVTRPATHTSPRAYNRATGLSEAQDGIHEWESAPAAESAASRARESRSEFVAWLYLTNQLGS